MKTLEDYIDHAEAMRELLDELIAGMYQLGKQPVRLRTWEEQLLRLVEDTPGITRAAAREQLEEAGCRETTAGATVSIAVKRGAIDAYMIDGSEVPPYYPHPERVCLYLPGKGDTDG